MRSWLLALLFFAPIGCDPEPADTGPHVQPAYSDSPWTISLAGRAGLADGQTLGPGPHRVEVWIESPGCGVHSVTVLFGADGQWSLDLAAERARLAKERKATILNVDASLMAEAPKLVPHFSAMRKKIAAALGVKEDQVNLKATTNEKIGFVGRGEGIAAIATAALDVPA